jgi:hypothetical protein
MRVVTCTNRRWADLGPRFRTGGGERRRADASVKVKATDTGQQFVEHRAVTPADLAYGAWGFSKVLLSEDDPLLTTALAVKALRYVVRGMAR